MTNHGIQNEGSHIRAHVSPLTRAVYVFKTADAVALVNSGRYPKRPATQPGYTGVTAWGFLVPVADVPDLRTLRLPGAGWWKPFRADDDTTAKGAKAVAVVARLLRMGRFPLWCDAEEVEDAGQQIAGTDIVAWGKWRIQVKHDGPAGPKELGGSGNLYLQVEEINPLGKH